MSSLQEKAEFLQSKIRQTKAEIDLISQQNRPDQKELSNLQLQLRFRLSNQTGKLQFIRYNIAEDISYRERQISEFSHRVKKILPDSKHLVFHGTPIYNAPKIIQSGKIVSGKDLWGFSTSGDPSGQFSVTTKDNIRDTVLGHSDLNAFIGFLPAGVIFVIHPKNEQEYQFAQEKGRIFNIDFKENPHRIHSLITTPENEKRVKGWLRQNGYNFPVYDYDKFILRIQRRFIRPQQFPQQKIID